MAKLVDLVQQVIRRLSLVPGTGVQIYAEERIAMMIEHTYDVVIEELWWPDLMRWTTVNVEPFGIVGGGLSQVVSLRDIKYVYYGSDTHPLPLFADRDNPTSLRKANQHPIYWTMGLGDGRAVLLPYGTVGDTCMIRYRARVPKPFLPTTDLPIDTQLLILGATYDFLEDDGTSVGAAAKFAEMFNARLKQLRTAWNEGDVRIGHGALSDDWQEV